MSVLAKMVRELVVFLVLLTVGSVILFFFLVLTSGCTLLERDVPRPTGPGGEEVDAPVGADEALVIAVSEWSWRLERELVDPPPVRWFAGPCLVYPDGPPCLEGAYVFGDLHPDEIHLVRRSERPSETSLAHEVLHWGLKIDRDGAADPDHSEPEWVDLEEVNFLLSEAGM